MAEIGEYLIRMGPGFGVLVIALPIAIMLALLAISVPRLLRRES